MLFRSMTIQGRFALYMFILVAISFSLTTIALVALPRNVQKQIDRELAVLVTEMIDESVRRGQLELSEQYAWPESSNRSYQTGSSFFVVLRSTDSNDDGFMEHTVLAHSENLPQRSTPLDPSSLDKNISDYTERDLVQSSDQPAYSTYADNNETVRVVTVPLRQFTGESWQKLGYLQIGRLTNDYAYYSDLIKAATFIGAASFSGLLAALGFVLPSMFRPINRIIDVAENISTADDLSRRIPSPEVNDETGQLVRVLNQLMGRLEQLFLVQKRLLGDVSHELRTPLTAIRGNVDLMRYMRTFDEESLDAIDGEAKRMSRLIDDLLTLARAESASQNSAQVSLELDKSFLQVYEQLTIIRSSVTLELVHLDTATVLGNEDRLTQVMINLITNALKYTDAGGKVKVSLKKGVKDAIFIVEDNGIGIPAEDLPHIFDRFYRVSKSRSREHGGTGLGLSIVKSIVETHNGTISITSEVGYGTLCTVRIPLSPNQTVDTESDDWE